MESKKRFLIIRLGAIGDLIHALPLADAIKTYYPDSKIDWVVGDKFFSVIKNNPLVDNVYIANLSKWRKGWFLPSTIDEICSFNKELQKNNYDYSIDAHGMFKSAVIQAFCGAKYRVGYSDYREGASFASNILVDPKSKRPHRDYNVIKRQLDLLTGSGILTQEQLNNYKIRAKLAPSSTKTVKKVDGLLSGINKDKKTVIFAPSTTWVNKHWDKRSWARLYERLKDKVNIIFSGTESDLCLIDEIRGYDANSLVLAGKTNLSEYIELISHADLVVSPDSSAAHIAFALNKPYVLTIFTATSKYTYAPIGDKCFAFPQGEQICLPCHKRKCAKKTMECTYQVQPDEIFLKTCELLGL